jgi:hypothetical protein
MSTPGENAKSRAAATTEERLEWQSELDSAMADIDTRLKHPRRRATDNDNDQPTVPQLGRVTLTTELLDEIAWRVAEQLRRTPTTPAGTAAPAAAPPRAAARPVPPPPPEPEPERMPHGIAITIRLRKPLFRFRFWRRRRVRRESLISFADYRIT